MLTIPTTDALPNAVISGVVYEGLTVRTRDGRPARLAILDDSGQVLADGDAVSRECWHVAMTVVRNYLAGNGHLRVESGPPGGLSPTAPHSKPTTRRSAK